ncbi:hypothetical protein LOY89_002537 [Ophidiomyces ophidiicola]|nr:hypothetical protein LOZ45_002179 [Ophidiomyces ophidiicola]KAI2053588.1 hypothetical protein LOZ44_002606 [Ophidiomyces ophidiicola]KAI2054487.1 hypothetical protein LOZ38_001285 [Ophidiomyces ophidiicola]KAI2065641.1 hypothetical protein LOZ37_006271 [Ophidiomyces ophidiicola]KAI2102399.1 hypothetical protein LOZ33_001505 [Ophidiomyces ophidiicola]
MPPKPKPSKPAAQPRSLPNWPPLKPLRPSSQLALHCILADQIYTISHLFPAALCRSYVSFLSTLPLATTPGRPRRGEAVRVNDRFQVDDAGFAGRLWSESGLADVVLRHEEGGVLWGGEVLGLNANVRVYRYTEGQFFGQHYDDSVAVQFASPEGQCVPGRTTWTLLIYLTTCTGGETVFYPEPAPSSKKSGSKSKASKDTARVEPIVVELEAGMALLHRHGDKCLLHEGREVTQGEKWVIRSDLVVKR